MRRRILASLGGKAIPYDEKLKYLKSNGNQHISTGVFAGLEVPFSFKAYASNTTSMFLFGGRLATKQSSLAFVSIQDYSRFDLSTNQISLPKLNDGVMHDVSYDGVGNLIFDGVTSTAISQHFVSNIEVVLFGCNTNGLISRGSFVVAKFNIGQNIFEPVLKDGVPCMYNPLDESFHYNEVAGHQFGYEKIDGTVVEPY